MERISIAQLKAGLSACLKKVQAGGTLLVTNRGEPVATLSPITPADGKLWMDMLTRLGVVSAPKAKLSDGFFRRAAAIKES